MPLVVNDQVVDQLPADTRSFFERYPHFKEMSSVLVSQVPKVVGPHTLLYVSQREIGVTVASDKHVSIIGTDDMTTCQCIILRHSASGAIGLGHFDGAGVEHGINTLVRRIQEMSPHDNGYQYGTDSKPNRFELYILGGYLDRRGYSDNIAMQLLYSCHKQAVHLHLLTACFGELNTVHRGAQNWPIIMGVGVNTKTGDIFPATYHDKGPELPLRNARFYTGSNDSKHQMFDIYDCSLGMMRIGPFNYEPMRGADLWLQQSDDFILQHLSTSPETEPPHFVMNIRSTFKYMQQHPFPGVTVFPDNRPHYFRKDEAGLWVPVCY